jgi:hypothetical protein
MAPRTRRSYTKGTTVAAESTRGTENENQVPFESSTAANKSTRSIVAANTSTRSIVAARIVLPGTQSQILHPGEQRTTQYQN